MPDPTNIAPTTASSITHPDSSFPTTLADLTFHHPNLENSNTNGTSTSRAQTSSSIYKTLNALRKSTLSIPRRLQSILHDAEFVEALWSYLHIHAILDNQHEYGVYRQNEPKASDSEPVPKRISRTRTKSNWPLIPNERSGSWPLKPRLKTYTQFFYLPPQPRGDAHNPSPPQTPTPSTISAYFKSTDGHISQWSFSTRRLNLQVLELLGAAGGAILIDTTRRGKSFPDALRRTVPIWCAVWNRVLFPEHKAEQSGDQKQGEGENGENEDEHGYEYGYDFQGFRLDESEVQQIRARIPGFVEDLKGLGLDFEEIRKKAKRPVRCVWANQPNSEEEWEGTYRRLVEQINDEEKRFSSKSVSGGVCVGVSANILVCCSASKQVVGAEMSEDGYIQGAGDDSEGWSHGLTARVFWENKQRLTDPNFGEEEMEELVRSLVVEDKRSHLAEGEAVVIRPTKNLFLSRQGELYGKCELLIDCGSLPNETAPDARMLRLGCREGKVGSKALREKLPTVKEVVGNVLKKEPTARIIVNCGTGKDLSVGVALMVLCCFYNSAGEVDLSNTNPIDKQFIKQRLAWISSCKPDANPSRATLQAVNSFLMERPG